MKVIYKGEIKRVPDMAELSLLQHHMTKVYKLSPNLTQLDGRRLKMYYIDEDGDVITIDCQSDFDEATTNTHIKIKIALALSVQEAKQMLIE